MKFSQIYSRGIASFYEVKDIDSKPTERNYMDVSKCVASLDKDVKAFKPFILKCGLDGKETENESGTMAAIKVLFFD